MVSKATEYQSCLRAKMSSASAEHFCNQVSECHQRSGNQISSACLFRWKKSCAAHSRYSCLIALYGGIVTCSRLIAFLVCLLIQVLRRRLLPRKLNHVCFVCSSRITFVLCDIDKLSGAVEGYTFVVCSLVI